MPFCNFVAQITIKRKDYEQANHHHHPARSSRNGGTGAELFRCGRRMLGKAMQASLSSRLIGALMMLAAFNLASCNSEDDVTDNVFK